MSRLRTLIRVDIRIDQRWAIGAAPDLVFRPQRRDASEAERVTRLPVQKDPGGDVLLPTTSLTGSLARHLGDQADKWLGSAEEETTVPSQLRCLAANVHDATSTEITTTAIDAGRRAPKANMLRTEEVLDPCLVTWWLEWDHHDAGLRLDDLMTRLKLWRPIIGRRRSADRGRAHVAAIHHKTVDLAETDDLTWWLGTRHCIDWTSDKPPSGPGWHCEKGGTSLTGDSPVLRCRFEVVDALHIGGAGISEDDDGHQVTETGDTLPSTSWRGIFRHRARHIVQMRTGDAELADRADQVVARLFGSGREAGASQQAGHRGQLRFADSPVSGGRILRTHVAIDRISGGSAQLTTPDGVDGEGLLFNLKCYGPGATLELAIYNDSDRPVEAGDRELLRQVIRDLDEGLIGVGGMTSRGYGTLRRVDEIEEGS